MVRRWIGIIGLIGAGLTVASALHRARRPRRHEAGQPEQARLTSLRHEPAGVRVVLETDLPAPGSFAATRCWLTEADGTVYRPRAILRQADALPLRETHDFAVPPGVTGLRLHLSAGAGEPELLVPVATASGQWSVVSGQFPIRGAAD